MATGAACVACGSRLDGGLAFGSPCRPPGDGASLPSRPLPCVRHGGDGRSLPTRCDGPVPGRRLRCASRSRRPAARAAAAPRGRRCSPCARPARTGIARDRDRVGRRPAPPSAGGTGAQRRRHRAVRGAGRHDHSPVRDTAVEALGAPTEVADVAVLWHVLEHLDDPALGLRRAVEMLGRHGRVVVSVPNLDSLQARIGGRAMVPSRRATPCCPLHPKRADEPVQALRPRGDACLQPRSRPEPARCRSDAPQPPHARAERRVPHVSSATSPTSRLAIWS